MLEFVAGVMADVISVSAQTTKRPQEEQLMSFWSLKQVLMSVCL